MKWQRAWMYALSSLLPFAVLAVRYELEIPLEKPLLIFFLPGIILMAIWGGLWPGVISTVMAGLISAHFVVSPAANTGLNFGYDVINWAGMVGSGLITSFLAQRRLDMFAESRKAQEHLVELELRHRNQAGLLGSLLQTLPDMVWFKDMQGRYVECNKRFQQFFGASKEQILGRSDYDFASKEEADFFREHDRLAIVNNGPTRNEEWVTFRSDGHKELLETTKTPVYDETGAVLGVLGIGHDITQRDAAGKALREREQQFRSLFDSMNEGAALHELVFDEQGVAADYRILEVNEAFYAQTGLQRGSIQGKKASEVYGSAPYLAEYERVARQSVGVRFEVYFEPMGRHFSISAFCPGENQFATVFEDITLQKTAQAELEQKNQQMKEQLNELRHWQDIMLNREDRVVQLKREVNRLCQQLGQPAAYLQTPDEPWPRQTTQGAPANDSVAQSMAVST